MLTLSISKDLVLRKWKDLSEMIEVECDGQDITSKLKEAKVHSVLFANIPSFGSGTRPWDPSKGEQRMDDGMIEVSGTGICDAYQFCKNVMHA